MEYSLCGITLLQYYEKCRLFIDMLNMCLPYLMAELNVRIYHCYKFLFIYVFGSIEIGLYKKNEQL